MPDRLLPSTTCADDVNCLAATLSGWNQEYNQIDAGIFSGVMQQFCLPGVTLYREQLNTSVDQHALTPDHAFTLLVPLHLHDERTTSRARCIDYEGLTLLPHCNAVDWVSPARADYAFLTVDENYLHPLLADADMELLQRSHRSFSVNSRPHLFAALQGEARRLTALSDGLELRQARDVAHGFIEALLEICTPRDRERQWQPLGNQHHAIVRQSIQYILSSEGLNAGVLDICRVLNIPRRTLNYSFERVTGTSPSRYLRSIRLNQARRYLMATDESIAAVASRFGFEHLPYFGKEYRLLFGETPGMTRHRHR